MKNILSILLIALSFSLFGQNRLSDRVGEVKGGIETIRINSQAANDTTTLEASVGIGETKVYVNDSISNTAVLKVAVGETLNGVIDGGFYFSNYSNGTSFNASSVSGGWIVSVDGASEQSDLHRFSFKSSGGGVSFNSSNIVGTGYQSLNLADVHVVLNDPFNLVDPNNKHIVIDNSGTYFATFNASANLAGVSVIPSMFVNGVVVLSSNTQNATSDGAGASGVVNLVAGDVVEFGVDGGGGSEWRSDNTASLIQLPTTESVLAGSVKPEDSEVILGSGTDGNITISTPWNTLFNDYEYVDFFVEEATDATGQQNRDRGYTRVTAEWLSVVTGSARTIDMTNGVVNSNSIVSVSIPINGESGTTANITVGSNWGSDNYTWRVVGVKKQQTVVMPDALTVEDVGEHKFTATANSAGNLPPSIAAISFDSYTDVVNNGSIATFDGTDIVVTAGLYDVELKALIHTDGSVGHNAITYFRDASDAIGLKFGDGVIQDGVSSRGSYGEGSDNSIPTAVVKAGTTVTLNVMHNASAGSQVIQEGSYISVKEIRGQKTVINTTDIPVGNAGVSDGNILKWETDKYIAGSDEYSTTETLTLKTYLGKPVYRILVPITLANHATATTLLTPHGIVDAVDEVIKVEALVSDVIQYAGSHEDLDANLGIQSTSSSVYHRYTGNWSSYSGYYLIEFTKQ